MSVWYEVEGSVCFKASAGLSIRRLLESMGVECIRKISQEKHVGRDTIMVDVSWSNSLDGPDAVKEITSFKNLIKWYDESAWIDITASIRFLG